jgi:hypothetical protein
MVFYGQKKSRRSGVVDLESVVLISPVFESPGGLSGLPVGNLEIYEFLARSAHKKAIDGFSKAFLGVDGKRKKCFADDDFGAASPIPLKIVKNIELLGFDQLFTTCFKFCVIGLAVAENKNGSQAKNKMD